MKTVSVYMLILVLVAGIFAGCRRRTDDQTDPTGASDTAAPTSATQATQPTVPATDPTQDETGGMMDDLITEGSEMIDDILPDGTNGNDATDGGSSSNHMMPGRQG